MKRPLISMLSCALFLISSMLYAQHALVGTSLKYPFLLPSLDYAYNGLEPFIDKETMEIHHSRHHAAYVTNLNKALEGSNNAESLVEMMRNISKYSEAIRNNGGGHYNHTLFWRILSPNGSAMSPDFQKLLEKSFGSVDNFKSEMNKAAMTRFGSGWAWLIVTADNQIKVTSTPNQDNPLMDVVADKGIPILGIDVWEHAYYLKYQNKRGDYLTAIWNVVNWAEVERNYQAAIKK